MALTIQNVADDVAYELRLLLDGTAGSGADYNLLARWIDQVNKEVLHTSVYSHMTRTTTPVTSVASTLSYTITPTNIRRVDAVFDGPGGKFLSPLENLVAPATLTEPPEAGKRAPRPPVEIVESLTDMKTPQYYWVSTVVTTGTPAHTLHVYPAPNAAENAGTITIYYTKLVTTVSGASTNLDVGDDGRDIMVAGVLARAYSYLHLEDKHQLWTAKYERLKIGEPPS